MCISMAGTLRCVASLSMVALLGACGRTPSVEARPDMGGAPVVTHLDPTTGRAGEDYPIALTLHGRGFAPTGNAVHFGSVPVTGLPSTAGGTRITLSVPKVMPSTGEVAPFVLLPGDYPVTVTTSRGTSEPVVFRLTRGRPEGEAR
jgi:hypothetical protein